MDLFGNQEAAGREERPAADPDRIYKLLWRLGPWGADEDELNVALKCNSQSITESLQKLSSRGKIWQSKRNGRPVWVARNA